MKIHLVRYALGLILLLGMLGHAAQLYPVGLIDRLDAIFYDVKLRFSMTRAVDSRIVIVDIDEKSLAEQGRWPWSRDRLALLTDKLFDRHGVKLVGFDVVFAEPDVSSGIQVLDSLAAHELRDNTAFQTTFRATRPQLDYDARFAAALRNRPVILGFYLSSVAGGHASGVLPAPTFPAGSFAGKPIDFTTWQTYGGNLPILQTAAAGAGHFNPLVDFDGISRRVPLLAEYKGEYYAALALAMVRALLGFPQVVPGYAEGGDAHDAHLEWLELPGAHGLLRIPVDENVATLIPYRGPQGSFPYISATDVLNDRISVERLKDRIILVGTTAPGLVDLRAAPVATVYPGVEVHANLIAGMLDGTIKHQPKYLMAADVLQILVAGTLMVFVLPLLSPLKATLLGLLVLVALLSLNFALWHAGHLVLPCVNGLLLVALLYALNMSWGYFVEARSKRLFTELFGQYVPPELVDEMAKNPAGYSMAGRKAELTVLFSDIRGFTSISESLPPDQLATLMNEYLGAMTAAVRQQRGTLDKYIGDAIMAFWGAPVADPEHARHAVLTALAMLLALQELNRLLMARGWPELRIGIGVNTGIMAVGDMGSPVRKAYTVMGDAVNLGSRLESITKQYGASIIISAGTRAKLGNDIVLRELDQVRVKGKAEAVGIYEPLGVGGQVPPETLEELTLWHQVLQSYRARDWEQADRLLLNLTRNHPHYLYDLYVKRIARYRQEPPDEGWDGVTTFETK